jgi:hypothetical protein
LIFEVQVSARHDHGAPDLFEGQSRLRLDGVAAAGRRRTIWVLDRIVAFHWP